MNNTNSRPMTARTIFAMIFALTSTAAVAGDEGTINQIAPMTSANQNFYLHPAHGFPGQAPGAMTELAMNQANAIAVENRKMYLHPAHGFPGEAPGFLTELAMNQSNPIAEQDSAGTHPALGDMPNGRPTQMAGDPERTDSNS